jgi:hypothetical protein
VTHTARDDEERLQVKFLPVKGAGHFGYIEHVPSGLIVHPKRGGANPRNDTVLVYQSGKHDGALFAFDEENSRIVHKAGKIWHPKGGKLSPSNDNACVLHSDVHKAAKFYFGNSNGDPISPYPDKPELGGDWKILVAFTTPEASSSEVHDYQTGRSLTKSVTSTNAWNVNAKAVYKLFKHEPAYSGLARRAEKCTWSEGEERTITVDIQKDKTLVLWHYVFTLSRYGEEWSFQSNIIQSTNSKHESPGVW